MVLDVDEGEELSVFDLPQLYSKPSAHDLGQALELLRIAPPSWEKSGEQNAGRGACRVDPKGVAKYLTSIIASPLAWIEDDNVREEIWENASSRLSERAGRTGMSSLTRSFHFLGSENSSRGPFTISLHEPALTADNLGFKTWASANLLAKRLDSLHFEKIAAPDINDEPRVLELGAGTGLAGLAAAATWQTAVHLTDLPDIVANLERNVDMNREMLSMNNGSASTGILDWAAESNDNEDLRSYTVIIAADPLYSPSHPALLCNTIKRYLSQSQAACVVVELPLREAYLPQIKEMKSRMQEIGLELLQNGEETGYDDWGGGEQDRGLAEVVCWWGVWGRQ